MIEAQNVKHGRVQIANLDWIFYDLVSHFVGLAIRHARLNAAAGHPNGESARIMIATDKLHGLTVAIFPHRGTPEFSAPDNQGIFQHAAFFQIGQQCGNRLIDFAAAVDESNVQCIICAVTPWYPSPNDKAG